MNTDRRSILKGLAAAGLVMATMPWAQAKPSLNTQGKALDSDALLNVTALVSGSTLDAAFMAGVQQAVKAPGGGQSLSVQPLQSLDAATFASLNSLLNDDSATLLVGLIDDASATLVIDLVRSAGGRVLSVQHHRVGKDAGAAQWAQALGQSLVTASPTAANAPTSAQGTAYVSLSCVI